MISIDAMKNKKRSFVKEKIQWLIAVVGSIFGPIRNRKDNFTLITKNITLIYEILKQKHRNSFQDEESLLVTCGTLNLITYLNEKSITSKDIDLALTLASLGECSLGLIRTSHITTKGFFLAESKDLLLNFIMQIECLIFYADNQTVSAKDIMNTVISKKNYIKKIIEWTKNNYNEILNSEYGQKTVIFVNGFGNFKKYTDERMARL